MHRARRHHLRQLGRRSTQEVSEFVLPTRCFIAHANSVSPVMARSRLTHGIRKPCNSHCCRDGRRRDDSAENRPASPAGRGLYWGRAEIAICRGATHLTTGRSAPVPRDTRRSRTACPASRAASLSRVDSLARTVAGPEKMEQRKLRHFICRPWEEEALAGWRPSASAIQCDMGMCRAIQPQSFSGGQFRRGRP